MYTVAMLYYILFAAAFSDHYSNCIKTLVYKPVRPHFKQHYSYIINLLILCSLLVCKLTDILLKYLQEVQFAILRLQLLTDL